MRTRFGVRAPSSAALVRVARHFVRHLELYLTAAGVVLTFAVPLMIGLAPYWQQVAFTGVIVAIVHGFLFWSVRERQRRVRRALINDVRGMLRDRVNNALTVVMIALDPIAHPDEPETQHLLRQARAAAEDVVRMLEELSLEALRDWRLRYKESIERLSEERA